MNRASNRDLFIFMATTSDQAAIAQAYQILRRRGYSDAQMQRITALFRQVVANDGDDFPSVPLPMGAAPVRPVPVVPTPLPTPVPIIPIVLNPDETNGVPEMPEMNGGIGGGEGDDLRDDFNGIGNGTIEGDGVIEVGLPGAPPTNPLLWAAMAALRLIMGRATVVTLASWNRLPGWARTVLAAAGIGIGIDLATDIPGIPGDSIIRDLVGGDGGPHLPAHLIDGHLGAHIVGSWEANGVTFYRLSDGKLAVQNKKGRWKVWRPKRPIVLMPGGATDLKTLLRADALLNRQAVKIAKMLNRRAPRRPKTSPGGPKGIVVVQNDGKSNVL